MSVRPTPSGQLPSPNVDRSGRALPAAPSARSGDASAVPGTASGRDDVQISSQARGLQQQGTAGGSPSGELSGDRMKEILGRIASGHYDRADVREQVIERVAADL